MDFTAQEIALLALVGVIAGLLPSTIAERRGIRLAADIGAGVAGVFVAAWLAASWRDLVPFSLTTPAGKPPEKVSVDINIPNYTPVVLPLAALKPLLKPVVFRSREEICDTLVHVPCDNQDRSHCKKGTARPFLLRASATFGVAPIFWRRMGSDEVRVRIAPAPITGQHVRPTFFDRAILAAPLHITVAHRHHRTPWSPVIVRCR